LVRARSRLHDQRLDEHAWPAELAPEVLVVVIRSQDDDRRAAAAHGFEDVSAQEIARLEPVRNGEEDRHHRPAPAADRRNVAAPASRSSRITSGTRRATRTASRPL